MARNGGQILLNFGVCRFFLSVLESQCRICFLSVLESQCRICFLSVLESQCRICFLSVLESQCRICFQYQVCQGTEISKLISK